MPAPKAAIIFWGMGVSQHTHGTDNARCLIALSLITGQIGRPGTGLHPLRGQNNVQGASDAGLIPMFFPDYKSVENPEIRAQYEKAWGVKLPTQARQDRGRDHGRGPRRRDQGHVHRGREPGDVGPGPQPRPPGAGASRASRGAGPVPHRDCGLCRRHAAGFRLAGEGRHRDQHQPPGADGPAGDSAAGRYAPGPLDHHRDRQPPRLRLELQARRRGVQRDGVDDAGARQHLLGARRARDTPSPIRSTGRTCRAATWCSRTASRVPAASPSWLRPSSSRRTRCRTPSIRSSSPPAASSSTGTPAR